MKANKKYVAPTPRYAVLQGSFWMSFCIIFAYASVFLLKKGFSNSEIGIIIAVAGGVSAFLQPLVADFADRSKKASLRGIISVTSLLMIIVAGVLLLPKIHMVLIAVFYGLAVAILQVLTPLVNAIGMECINRGIPVNFGVARGVGSISYAAVSYIAGTLVATYDAIVIPIMIIVFYVILLIGTLSFTFSGKSERNHVDTEGKKSDREKEVIEKEDTENAGVSTEQAEKHRTGATCQQEADVPFYKRYTKFFILLLGVTCSFVSHNLLNNYMFQIMQYHGGTSSEMGTALAIAATVELPTMLGFAYIVKRISCGTLIKVSATFFFIKAVLMLLAPNIFFLYVAQGAQIFGFALQVPASVYYVNQLMREEDRVKGQAFMTVTNTLGSIAGSLTGGVLLDALGVNALLLVSAGIALAGVIITYVSTEHTENR